MTHLRACGAFLCFAAFPALAQAQGDSTDVERRVKAAYLYKFSGYVQWPEGVFPRPDAPIVIGVFGEDQLAAELSQQVVGRTVEGRPVVVRKLRDGEALAGAHVLFIGRAESGRLGQLIRAAQAQPTLVVTDCDGALAQGSAINFVLSGGRLRFEASPDNAGKRTLKLSSRLLSVALNPQAGAN